MIFRPSSTTAASRTGFSVLELVVTMTIGLVLMSAIWTMFNIFTKRQEVDRIQTERSQLIRGLHQLLSRDMANIVPQNSGSITRGATSDRATSAVSPFSLPIPFGIDLLGSASDEVGSFVGSDRQMQILVFVDGVATEPSDESIESAKGFSASRSASVDWPFRSIVYRWEPAIAQTEMRSAHAKSLSLPGNLAGKSGLSRRETFYASRSEPSSEVKRDSHKPGSAAGFGFQLGTSGISQQAAEPTEEQLICEETVTEFSDAAFEYFDGSDWRESWDSRETGSLPAAIRVSFNLRIEKIARPSSRFGRELSESPTSDSRSERTDSLNQFEHQFTLIVSRNSKPTKSSEVSRFDSTQRAD